VKLGQVEPLEAAMRAIWIGLAAGLLLSAAASADDPISNQAQGWIAPKNEDVALRAKWPRDANGKPIYGKVTLDCGIDGDGRASDCRPRSSDPPNPALEKAVQALAPFYTTKDRGKARRPLVLSLTFDTPPDWLKKPSLDDLLAVYPAQAFKKGLNGVAVIKCIVQTTGLTRACSVTKEDHPGMGFGSAALVLSRTFLFRPALREGQPVEAEVSIPVNFVTYGKPDDEEEIASGRIRRPVPSSPSPTTVLGEAAWSKTPTVSDILSEINKKVGDKFAEGQVVFQCRLDKKSGKLSGCVVANASPGMAQFRGVAKSLIPRFQADPNILASAKGDVLVNLAFAFPDMSSPAWAKRYLTHPTWLRTISADPDKPTFPEQAAKAGLKTGSATVDCVVAPNGALTQCQVISESTPGVGFGPMAQAIAQVFVANPWGEDGLPVDGAHVRMPIQMNYEPPPVPAAPPAPAPTPATKP